MKKYIIAPEIEDKLYFYLCDRTAEPCRNWELLTEVGTRISLDYKGREHVWTYSDDDGLSLSYDAWKWLIEEDKDLFDYGLEWDDWACAVWKYYGAEMIEHARKWLAENDCEEGTIKFCYTPEEVEAKASAWIEKMPQIERDMRDAESEADEDED